MEAAIAFLCTADAALYFAALSLTQTFEEAYGALILALVLSFGMLLLAGALRYRSVLRIAVSPLPFLGLLLLPFGRAWIFFIPVPLTMTLIAALDRFDWDEERTARFMRVLIGCGVVLLLPSSLSTPPRTKSVAMLVAFLVLAVIGLRLLRSGDGDRRRNLYNITGVLIPTLIGVGGGLLLGTTLTRPDILLAPVRWFFIALGWLFGKLMEHAKIPEEEMEPFFGAVPSAEVSGSPTPTPSESLLPEAATQPSSPMFLSVLGTLLFILVAAALIALILRNRERSVSSYVGDTEYFPEQREEEKKPRARRRRSLSVDRVREAYRNYLLLLENASERKHRPSETSLEVQQRAAGQPGAQEAEELRKVYLRARYAEKTSAEDARRAETAFKSIRRLFREQK